MCLRCFADTTEKQEMYVSNSFIFKIECPSTIDAFEPLSIVTDQTVVMDGDSSFTP
jgi:hypothetical protein